MYANELINIGLTKTQAVVFDYLLDNGEKKAIDISKKVGNPRGVVYTTLEELIKLGLAEKIENTGQIARFRAMHPRTLETVIEEKEKDLSKNKKMLAEILPLLSSKFNIGLHKPGIKFYEGEEGFRKILFDTLSSRTEVYLFINNEALTKEEKFKKINEEYKEKRKKLGLVKKIIRSGVKDETVNISTDEVYEKITAIKYLNKETSSFKASMHIYDNKISYELIDENNFIAILIEDKNIYEMHKAFFDSLWAVL
jgi:sugar-specific transcriptional regulator TrmB